MRPEGIHLHLQEMMNYLDVHDHGVICICHHGTKTVRVELLPRELSPLSRLDESSFDDAHLTSTVCWNILVRCSISVLRY